MRFVPGMYVDEVLWLRDGEIKTIPGTNEEFVLESKGFKQEMYDKEKDNKLFEEAIDRVGVVIKNFQTDVVLYKRDLEQTIGEDKQLTKVKEHEIRVNEPLKFDKYAIYQVSYKLNELRTMSFALQNKETETIKGELTIDLLRSTRRI